VTSSAETSNASSHAIFLIETTLRSLLAGMPEDS
jgi:hypothetical protein